MRAGSLIVTVFGDVVAPRGGEVSLALLLAITRGMRLRDGMVRTALSRLRAEGWLERRSLGRSSAYRLSQFGHGEVAAASSRIYGPGAAAWDGSFDILVLASAEDRAQRAGLERAGWGTLAPSLAIAPAPAPAAAIGPQALRLSAQVGDEATARRLGALAWPLAALEARYGDFLAAWEPIAAALVRATPGGQDALMLRILLIHDWRRIVLKDPLLPPPLLPPAWAGARGRRLCAAIYARLVPAAEAWLDGQAQAGSGPLPRPSAALGARFPGEQAGRPRR